MSPLVGFSGFGGGATAQTFAGGGVKPILWGGDRALCGRGTGVDYWSISTGNNASNFGELIHSNAYNTAVSNIARAVFTRGGSGDNAYNNLVYFTIANTGNATDFGDQTVGLYGRGGASNGTIGFFMGGTSGAGNMSDVIDKITIASTGNATDWNDIWHGVMGCAGCGDDTRVLNAAGANGGYYARIDYQAYSTDNGTSDFGDLSYTSYWIAACADAVTALFGGGVNGSGTFNNIETVTIQTTGNATDFGDLAWTNREHAGTGDATNGCFAGGKNSANNANGDSIMYVTFATPGNAVDTCDLASAKNYVGACSGD